MITLVKRINAGVNRFVDEYRGISDDTKPEGKLNGSTFFEMDTGTTYYYDEDNDSDCWIVPTPAEVEGD